LELYKPELVSKPAILIFNKLDTKGAEELYGDTVKKVKFMRGEQFAFLRLLSFAFSTKVLHTFLVNSDF